MAAELTPSRALHRNAAEDARVTARVTALDATGTLLIGLCNTVTPHIDRESRERVHTNRLPARKSTCSHAYVPLSRTARVTVENPLVSTSYTTFTRNTAGVTARVTAAPQLEGKAA